jgi:hypothetical protein
MAFVFFSLNEKGGNMAHYLVQASYSSGSWAAQIKNPQNRIEQVGKILPQKELNSFRDTTRLASLTFA